MLAFLKRIFSLLIIFIFLASCSSTKKSNNNLNTCVAEAVAANTVERKNNNSLPSAPGLGGNALRTIGTLYVANGSAGIGENYSVASCPVLSDGTIQTCSSSQSTSFLIPQNVTVDNLGNYAYISNINGTVSICQVNENGTLKNCIPNTGEDTFSGPFGGVILNHSNTLAYVANYNADKVSICSVSPKNGKFSDCNLTTGKDTIKKPNGRIDFNPSGTKSYIANYGNKTVSICSLSSDGEKFKSCEGISNPTFHGLKGLALDHQGKFAYIANSDGESSFISICSLNSDGDNFEWGSWTRTLA